MDIMTKERVNFRFGCAENNISEEIADKIYDQMIDFAKYAFNKSHAACYAAISMQTAYLKCHYPLEFMAGLLSSVMDKPKKLMKYVATCRRSGINILPPDINSSRKDFTIRDGKLQYGLLALKGVGEPVLDAILAERDTNGSFRNIMDIITRLPQFNKSVAESMVKAGALDFSGHTRAAMLKAIPDLIAGNRKENKKQVSGQMSLFDLDEEQMDLGDPIVDEPEFSKKELLEYEKEATTIYLSGHPLDDYRQFLQKNVTVYADDLQPDDPDGEQESSEKTGLYDGEKANMAGIVVEKKVIFTKKSQRPMAFLTLEDETGSYSVIVFPDTYDKFRHLLEDDAKLYFQGTISTKDGQPSVIADNIIDLETLPKKLWIQFLTSAEKSAAEPTISDLRSGNPGNDMLICYTRETQEKDRSHIAATNDLFTQCRKLFGEENVKITY